MTTTATGTDIDIESQEKTEERVVAVLRELARELGGDRAASAVSATASLERDVGLGSLERVELLTRLESELGRELADRYLLLDTAREIARAAPDAPVLRGAPPALAPRQPPAAPLRLGDVTTLVDALERRATAEPNRVHVFLHTNGDVQKVTYAELWDGAARIARGLHDRGVKRGEPVAIMLPTSLDYLQSFMGVLAAGGIAVPLYPPARLDRLADYLQRQARILGNANARLMISLEEAAPVAHMLRHAAPALETILTADALRRGKEPLIASAGDEHDAALIQYTSGSTGDPKGVLLTHANLLANIRAIAAGVRLVPTDAAVSWLPLYHDMGLIGTWLNAMVNGIPLTLMSPLAFLARPERWLWAIHEQQATLSPAPNFAYELCVRKIRDDALVGLDLSSWRCASNGSEPVSAATLDRFARRFAPFGLRREALFPVYGLAECSVALCFPPVGRAPLVEEVERETFERDGRAVPAAARAAAPLSFVSVGRPLPEHEVRLVDDGGTEIGERRVGRLLFRGPSCMSEYYRNPGATARTISSDGWIDSGDLAYRANDELFITGRVKDLIIKGGRNLVPQEIEEVVGAINGIRKGCVAAFGVPDEVSGTERLIVLAESRSTADDERARLEREAVTIVATEVGVPPDIVRIVPPGTIPKTPSGKIRRGSAREAFEAGRVGHPPRVPLGVRARLTVALAARALRGATRIATRALQVLYLFVAWTIAIAVLAPIVAILLLVLPDGRPVRIVCRIVAQIALRLSGCRVTVEGAEHVSHAGPAVFVSNHTSYADTPVLVAAVPVDFVFVAMAEIASWRVIGMLARRGRHLTVDRWHLRQSVTDAAAVEQRLRAGERVLFFAEGGFSRVRGLRPFRLGAFEAAAAAGVPVIPIALRGTRELLPADTYIPRPGRVHVWIGDAIHPAGRDWNAIIALRDQTADAIAAHSGEPRLQTRVLRPVEDVP
jgi:1-acyl-sn-glycerol-3-phosphate acyltransferase